MAGNRPIRKNNSDQPESRRTYAYSGPALPPAVFSSILSDFQQDLHNREEPIPNPLETAGTLPPILTDQSTERAPSLITFRETPPNLTPHVSNMPSEDEQHSDEERDERENAQHSRTRSRRPAQSVSYRDVPIYNGENEGYSARRFLRRIDQIAKMAKWDANDCLQTAIIRVGGTAREFVEIDTEANQAMDNSDWPLFKELLLKRFEEPTNPHEIRNKLSKIKQNVGENCREFAARISRAADTLCEMYPDLDVAVKEFITKDILTCFLEGLREGQIKFHLHALPPATISEAVTMAGKLEQYDAPQKEQRSEVRVHTFGLEEKEKEPAMAPPPKKKAEPKVNLKDILADCIAEETRKNNPNAPAGGARNFHEGAGHSYPDDGARRDRQPCLHCNRTNHSVQRCFALQRLIKDMVIEVMHPPASSSDRNSTSKN